MKPMVLKNKHFYGLVLNKEINSEGWICVSLKGWLFPLTVLR